MSGAWTSKGALTSKVRSFYVGELSEAILRQAGQELGLDENAAPSRVLYVAINALPNTRIASSTVDGWVRRGNVPRRDSEGERALRKLVSRYLQAEQAGHANELFVDYWSASAERGYAQAPEPYRIVSEFLHTEQGRISRLSSVDVAFRFRFASALTHGDVPDYVPRDIDGDFIKAVSKAIEHTSAYEERVIVLQGHPKAGKTRTAVQLLQPTSELLFSRFLDVKTPGEAEGYLNRFTRKYQQLAEQGARKGIDVVFIDDLHEHFSPYGSIAEQLLRLVDVNSGVGHTIVVATCHPGPTLSLSPNDRSFLMSREIFLERNLGDAEQARSEAILGLPDNLQTRLLGSYLAGVDELFLEIEKVRAEPHLHRNAYAAFRAICDSGWVAPAGVKQEQLDAFVALNYPPNREPLAGDLLEAREWLLQSVGGYESAWSIAIEEDGRLRLLDALVPSLLPDHQLSAGLSLSGQQHFQLGVVYWRLGRDGDAVEELKAALDSGFAAAGGRLAEICLGYLPTESAAVGSLTDREAFDYLKDAAAAGDMTSLIFLRDFICDRIAEEQGGDSHAWPSDEVPHLVENGNYPLWFRYDLAAESGASPEYLEKMIREDMTEEAIDHPWGWHNPVRLADRYVKRGDLKAAERVLRGSDRWAKQDYALARFLVEHKRWDEAESEYREMAKGGEDVTLRLAEVLARSGRMGAAIELVNSSGSISDRYSFLWEFSGEEAALEFLRLRAQEGDVEAMIWLYDELGSEREVANARHLLEGAVQRAHETTGKMHVRLLQNLIDAGEYGLLEELGQLLRWWEPLFIGLEGQGRVDEALGILESVEHDYPYGQGSWRAVRARLLVKTGDDTNANKELRSLTFDGTGAFWRVTHLPWLIGDNGVSFDGYAGL